MGVGLYSHTTRAIGTILTNTIYNGDHQNHINNHNLAMIDDYSSTVTEMESTADPYPASVASQATSAAGEIERLRYQILGILQVLNPAITKWEQDAVTANVYQRGYYSKLICGTNTTNPDYQVDVDADAIILEDSSNEFYQALDVNLTVDITASGVNGLDTGSEASDTWYYVWVIYDGTTVAGLLSTSATAPTMPSGYTYKKLVTSVRNDSSSDFIQYSQEGNYIEYLENTSKVLTGQSDITFTDVDCSGSVPEDGYKIKLKWQISTVAGAQLGILVRIRKNGSAITSDRATVGFLSGDVSSTLWQLAGWASVLCDSSQIIEYLVDDANTSCTLIVTGYWIRI